MEQDKNTLEAEYAKILAKVAEAAKLIREAGKIAEASDIDFGSKYDWEYYDYNRDSSDLSEEEKEARYEKKRLENSLGDELERAMAEAGWNTSSWGC